MKCVHLFYGYLDFLTTNSCIFYLQDITKPISEEMCELLKRKRDFFSGLRLKQEILLCKLLYNLFMIEIRLILLKLLIDVFSITYTCYMFFSY